jgi:RNA polymerase sigma factor (sigma-70 family)
MRNGLGNTWRRVRSLLGARAGAATDAQLLACFATNRDEAAFAEIVRRYGSLVHGVCRRILGNPHDADDAYQATFLILSRKPTGLRKVESLSSWLHGVALRVAIRLKRNLLRRKDRAPLAVDVPQTETDDVSWGEVQRLLDEELARLPEQFRQPLILCYLEGKTRDEAADELGWSPSTFRGRLERARQRLRWRLERRGLTLSAALLATLAASRSDAAPFSLTKASAPATSLATEVMRSMFMAKMKSMLLWCIAVLFVSAGVGATAYRCVAVEPGEPRETSAPKATKPTAEPAKPPTPPEEDGVVKDYKAHLDRFRLTITLRPEQLDNLDQRYPVSDLRLRVWNGPIAEPGGKGTVIDQITKEQAAKIIDVLVRDNFFRDSVSDWERLKPPKGDHIVLHASYHIGDEPQVVQRIHALDWDLHMVQQLEAIRQCVDGEAARHLDKMLQSLADLRSLGDNDKLLLIEAVDDLDILKGSKIETGVNAKKKPVFLSLDAVLPFREWPEKLTDEQSKLRKDGLKLAKKWLENQTVEFSPTEPLSRCGDLVRYVGGPTKVAQAWQGQTPAELSKQYAFHINVLLIQEGYSPFVAREDRNWDKRLRVCYESAEAYAELHKKGVWKDPEFAQQLKTIASVVREHNPWESFKWLEQALAQLPSSPEATRMRYELAEKYRRSADKLEKRFETKDQEVRSALEEWRERAGKEYENLITIIEKPESAEHLGDVEKRDVYYFAAFLQFRQGDYDKSLAAFVRMAKRYRGEPDYWTAVAGMISAYTGKKDINMVRVGLMEIRAHLNDMSPETRDAMERYVKNVEKSLPLETVKTIPTFDPPRKPEK